MSEDSSEISNKKRNFSQFINSILELSGQIDDHNLSKSKPSKLCVYHDCYKTASYNFPGKKERLYCSKHKREGMMLVRKFCTEPGCAVYPAFNYPGEKKRLYCVKHKKEGMINIIGKICIELGCKKHSSFNFPGEKERLYCAKHKKEGMVLVK